MFYPFSMSKCILSLQKHVFPRKKPSITINVHTTSHRRSRELLLGVVFPIVNCGEGNIARSGDGHLPLAFVLNADEILHITATLGWVNNVASLARNPSPTRVRSDDRNRRCQSSVQRLRRFFCTPSNSTQLSDSTCGYGTFIHSNHRYTDQTSSKF